MNDIQLKLDFVKRVLLGVPKKDITENFFRCKEFPAREIMETVVSLPIPGKRRRGADWPDTAHTMVGLHRLDNLNECLDTVRKTGVLGDFIETGVWRGGVCIFMSVYNKLYDMGRKVYVTDSFQGLPPPDKKYPNDTNDKHHTVKIFSVGRKQVEYNFSLYNALDENVIFLEGWFKDTVINNSDIGKLSILRLDGDMYGSTIEVLDGVYDKLQVGGIIIVDDYGSLSGCRRAVNDFRRDRNIVDEIKSVDWTGVYWVKT